MMIAVAFFEILKILFITSLYVHTYATVCLWRPEEELFQLHHVDPRN